MICFKDIKKGQFFQDIEFHRFDPKHCYLKTGMYQYFDLENCESYDVRQQYEDLDILGKSNPRFTIINVDIKIN